MLFYVAREQHRYTIDRLLESLRANWPQPPDRIRVLSYETLFARKRAPIGNYLFTDIDRLSGYEVDSAAEIAKGLRKADPNIRISNPPHRVLGRYALLRQLYEAGLNSFNVWRLDEERAPTAYPVFIRREQDALGPESALLYDESDYRAAVAALQAAGKGLTGRIAVQFVPSADSAGIHRKYGAFHFRGRVVPQHLMLGESWIVKRGALVPTDAANEEELRYVEENPHADHLREVFRLAGTDFGRVDYCVSGNRVEIFEINTNPSFPRAKPVEDGRSARRRIVLAGILQGFADLDPPHHGRGLAKFHFPQPKLHRLRDRSMWRRLGDIATGLRWRLQLGGAPSQDAARQRQSQQIAEQQPDGARDA